MHDLERGEMTVGGQLVGYRGPLGEGERGLPLQKVAAVEQQCLSRGGRVQLSNTS